MPREIIPGLVLACRMALAISFVVFSYRAFRAVIGRPTVFLSADVLTDVAVFGYTMLLIVWLAVEAVGELHRVGEKLSDGDNRR